MIKVSISALVRTHLSRREDPPTAALIERLKPARRRGHLTKGDSPVTTHSGPIDDIRRHTPSFERRPFALPDANNLHFRENRRLDTVVRLPHEDDRGSVPVGVVSKDYVLLPHTEVLDLAVRALEVAKLNPADVRAELRISDLGERMALAFVLPDVFLFDPGDRFPMQVRLECLNSMDGSTRFRAEMGWFRLVFTTGCQGSGWPTPKPTAGMSATCSSRTSATC